MALKASIYRGDEVHPCDSPVFSLAEGLEQWSESVHSSRSQHIGGRAPSHELMSAQHTRQQLPISRSNHV